MASGSPLSQGIPANILLIRHLKSRCKAAYFRGICANWPASRQHNLRRNNTGRYDMNNLRNGTPHSRSTVCWVRALGSFYYYIKRFGVNRFWILVCIMAEQEWNKIEQSRTKVEKVGIKRWLSREFSGCIIIPGAQFVESVLWDRFTTI